MILDALAQLILVFLIGVFYVPILIWIILLLNIGVYSGIIILIGTSPFIIVWVKTMVERARRFIETYYNSSIEWNVEKCAREYIELIKKEKNKDV